MPKTECRASASQGSSVTASNDMNGARRATPSSEMLAAPSRNAVQTLSGGPRTLVGGDYQPQHQQRRRDSCGPDDGGERFKQVHLSGNMVDIFDNRGQ